MKWKFLSFLFLMGMLNFIHGCVDDNGAFTLDTSQSSDSSSQQNDASATTTLDVEEDTQGNTLDLSDLSSDLSDVEEDTTNADMTTEDLDENGCDRSGGGYWSPEAAAFECEVLALTNQRRSEGADCDYEGSFEPTGPLAMDEDLRLAARRHSQDMADRNYFSHDSPDGPYGDDMVERIENAGYIHWTMVGENIAAGQTTPEEVVDGWMHSPGHCANIMNPDFEEIGIGYYFNENSDYGHYWTQDFGTPQ